MTSSFLFGCCQNSQTLERTQQSHNSVSRNIINKNKSFSAINSPKASLKSINSSRKQKIINKMNTNNNLHMIETIDVAQQTQKINLVSSGHIIKPMGQETIIHKYINPEIRPIYINQFILNPPVAQQKILPIIYQKPTYINQNSQIYKKFTTFSQVEKKNPQNKQIKIQKPQVLPLYSPKSRISIEQKKPVLQQNPQKPIKENKKFLNHLPRMNGNLLGGSKFTILSQQQIQYEFQPNQKQIKMEQSAIILNVFNPSKSQMQNWNRKQSTISLNSNRSKNIHGPQINKQAGKK